MLAPAQSLQLCLTLCDPMDYSTLGSTVHRISQARILEWVAISSSRGSSWPRDQNLHLLVPLIEAFKYIKKKIQFLKLLPSRWLILLLSLKFSPSLTHKTPRPISPPTSLPVFFSFTSPASKYRCSSKHNSSGLFSLAHGHNLGFNDHLYALFPIYAWAITHVTSYLLNISS